MVQRELLPAAVSGYGKFQGYNSILKSDIFAKLLIGQLCGIGSMGHVFEPSPIPPFPIKLIFIMPY